MLYHYVQVYCIFLADEILNSWIRDVTSVVEVAMSLTKDTTIKLKTLKASMHIAFAMYFYSF